MSFEPVDVGAASFPSGRLEHATAAQMATRKIRAISRRITFSVLRCCTKLIVLVAIGGFLCATMVRFGPGYGVDEVELDSRLNAASIQALRSSQNVDVTVAAFYFQYWSHLLHGDLGISRSLQEPVWQLIRERSPETLKMVGVGLLIGWALGMPLAIGTVVGRSHSASFAAHLFASVMLCIPAGLLALLCVLWQVPGRLVLGIVVFPKIFTYTRNLLLRSVAMPHVITAEAKGLSPWRIFGWHVLPSAGPQLLALAGVSVSLAFAGAIPVEVLCDISGIGQLAWTAALGRDLNVLVLITLGITAITLLANSLAEVANNEPALRLYETD